MLTHCSRLLGYSQGRLFATGWCTDATENHLYAIAPTGDLALLTEPGWHDIVFNTETGVWIDIHSATTSPPSITHKASQDATPVSIYTETIDEAHPYIQFWPLHQSPQFGEIKTADGTRLHYRFTPPVQTGMPQPAIVYVYGGPGAQKVRNQWPPLLLQLFAQNGIGVFELDNRGSANRGRDFEAPLYRRMGTVEVADQLLGLDVLRSLRGVDPERIGVFGHSYGGYMTLMCLCQAPNRFKAGVAVAPVCDWQLYDSHYTERYMGMPEENSDGYEHGNVLTHLSNLQDPLLLMHGMADDNVLFTHSTMIMGALQALNKPFELMTYPGAKHSMQEAHVSTHRFELILDFFARRL